MKPVIGLTARYDEELKAITLGKGYYEAVIEAGGIPLALPCADDKAVIAEILEIVDGLILTGGEDVDPKYFNENPVPKTGGISPIRDAQEIFATASALRKDIPMLGICRGIQVMNIAAGGTIYQDIYSQINDRELFKHCQSAPKWYGTHTVKISGDTKLISMLKDYEIEVNSFHHQAIKDLARGFISAAKSDDGIIEAIEHKEKTFALGVQWHPELMWKKDKRFLQIFNSLIENAVLFKNKKKK